MMIAPARKVLITGCSDGGMGAALALAFHKQGLEVYATARNPDKMAELKLAGIKTIPLDVQSESSIAECVAKVPALDILVNNAGAVSAMPLLDARVSQAKDLFDLNVWSYLAVTQAFIPLLLKSSNGMIVNHTSAQTGITVPFAGIYGASKAALSSITQNLRLELEPFNIKVVEMKTADVKTNIIKNLHLNHWLALPENSLYDPARNIIENITERFEGIGPTPEDWASSMSTQLVKKNPRPVIWSGGRSGLVWFLSCMPLGWADKTVKRMTGLDAAEKVIRKERELNRL